MVWTGFGQLLVNGDVEITSNYDVFYKYYELSTFCGNFRLVISWIMLMS